MQVLRAGDQPHWGPPVQLPGIGSSPHAPDRMAGRRPLTGATPLLAPEWVAAGAARAATGAPGTLQQSAGPGAAVQRLPAFPATPAASHATPSRFGAGPAAGQSTRTLLPESHRTSMAPVAPPAGLPPVQRGTAARLPDPGAAAIAAGVASRDADGSVVFRSLLDDAMSSGKEAASSAASNAIADARSTATDAASSALTSATSAAKGAVSSAASTVASAAGLPAPAGAGTSPPADLDDLARKLYDRLRFRLTTELRLDRERSGCVTDLPR